MRKLTAFSLLFILLTFGGCIYVRYPLEVTLSQRFDKKIETEHFIFYLHKEDNVDLLAQEYFYEYITNLFGTNFKDKIIYVKCRDDKDFKKVWGGESNRGVSIGGVAGEYRDKNGNLVPIIISKKEWENHELVHILQPQDCRSTTFFNEGLAVAFSINPLKNDYIPLHRWCWDMSIPIVYLKPWVIEQGDYINLDEILTSKEFEVVAGLFTTTTAAYLEAGSFTKYLIDNYGLETLFRLLKISNYSDSKSEIEEKFLKVYEISIQEMEKRWLKFVKENY